MLAVYGAIFLWVFNKPAVVDFFIATESEMKKVNWPSRKEIVGATWIVICGTFLMALLLLVIDAGFAWLFTKIGILEGLS
ncbi:MAG: preprotein translocase subunit SecE [Planctomycetes bacterium]|nr:preprotein translocase subunit SecE [Planctomycetota bacterium]